MAASGVCLHILTLYPPLVDRYTNHGNFYSGDAGLDVFAPERVTVPAGARGQVVKLGISTEMVETLADGTTRNLSYYLYPRSSMGSRTPLRLSNSVGIIDAGYRGQLCVILDNISDKDYTISAGDKLVQICHPHLIPFSFRLVGQLSLSDRGSNGLGSTSKQ